MPTEPSISRNSVVRGILWMGLTGLLFACVTGIVRHLGTDMPAMQAAFIRYAIGLVMISPLLGPLFANPPPLSTLRLHALRGILHGIAVILWFFAMARVPIAEVTAIGFTAPIFVTIGAAIFLGEALRLRRIIAIGLGFGGTLIIIQPGFEIVSTGQLAQLCAAPLFAASFIVAKKLTEHTDPAVIVASLSVFCTVVLLPGAIYSWRTPTVDEIFWLAVTAAFATSGHYSMTRALRAAPITVTQPISFLQLVWAALIGYLIFAETIEPAVMFGGGIIVAATTYISYRESFGSRRSSTPPPPAMKS